MAKPIISNPARRRGILARTLTISFDGIGKANLGRTLGLRSLTGDEVYAFQAFTTKGQQKRLLTVGASEDNDIVIEDLVASRFHCLIDRQRRCVLVHDCDSKNGVWLDGVRVQIGELRPHSTLTLGRTTLVAYGSRDDRGANVKATNPDQYLRHAVALYGSIRAASRGLSVAYSTLRDKLEKITGKARAQGQRSPGKRGKAGAAKGTRSKAAQATAGAVQSTRNQSTTPAKAKATPAKRAGARAARSRRGRAKRRR
jgi:pSer/pThr/pTyr-binding forkhead associated (FHA) protein